MNIKEVQDFNRRAIIWANHFEAATYEEALEKELGFGCEVEVSNRRPYAVGTHTFIQTNEFTQKRKNHWFIENLELDKLDYNNIKYDKIYKILGQPLTLDRVLVTLSKVSSNHNKNLPSAYKDTKSHTQQYIFYITDEGELRQMFFNGDENYLIGKWNLSEKTLEKQNEEIQFTIAKELGYQELIN